MSRSDRLLPRAVHPGAWWLWALGLATAASRTTNPLLLGLVLAVAAAVVRARRSDAPWARSFVVFLKLGLVVIAVRVIAQVLLSPAEPGTVLLDLPQLPLPAWAAGVTLGGPVTAPTLARALGEGLRLATVLGCLGAANALANPKRLLAALPGALYEVGVAVVVALSFAPSLVAAVARIRSARRLRGRPDRGIRSLVSVAMPVLEDALERSLALAAAMDSRGYGRQAPVPPRARRGTSVLTLGGLGGLCLGLYGLLDAGGPTVLALPVLLAGGALAVVGLARAGRRAVRTRYRPDPWAAPEWVTALSGAAAAAGVLLVAVLSPALLDPSWQPLAALPLPWPAALGTLVAVLPAVATPPPPHSLPPARTGAREAAHQTSTAPREEARA